MDTSTAQPAGTTDTPPADPAGTPAAPAGEPGRTPIRIGILTSGGDAQGMNAAVRAATRTALARGAQVYAIYEGYQGMIEGGDSIRPLSWSDVGSILHLGGTVIGTARSAEFRERDGRRTAAANLLDKGIDRLIVIGGDGSLSGFDAFRQEWPSLLDELVAAGRIERAVAQAHPALRGVGLVGSIDNDMVGTDMTIGADSALHRIVDAIDAISSTAASHQRSFVVEVMGRHCGYLPLMAAVAGGADYALIPENPPPDGWEDDMCNLLRLGRESGRRDSIVIVAEGAADRSGQRITTDYVCQVLRDRLGEDTRATILGHVQRGGAPSAYDRWMSSLIGRQAAIDVLEAGPDDAPQVLGIRSNRIHREPLVESVQRTRSVADLIAAGKYDEAMTLRGRGFVEMVSVLDAMTKARPSRDPVSVPKRVAILNAGGLAPGMNTAARAAVRLGLDRGLVMLGVDGSFDGLAQGRVRELGWADVEGWTSMGGAELGTFRQVPTPDQLYDIGRTIEQHRIDALLVIGGWNGYVGLHTMHQRRADYSVFKIPMLALPASIDNNLPGWELAIGADTALNVIVEAVDRIKQSAMAARRCFVVETMGRFCGYLALVSGVAGGAERVYLNETGITLASLAKDVTAMTDSFRRGRRLFLTVMAENANPRYTTDFLARLFEEEGGRLFDVRQAVLGHVQQGGNPSPFDRIIATRLASQGLHLLIDEMAAGRDTIGFIGRVDDAPAILEIDTMDHLVDWQHHRPKDQWWMKLADLIEELSHEPVDEAGEHASPS